MPAVCFPPSLSAVWMKLRPLSASLSQCVSSPATHVDVSHTKVKKMMPKQLPGKLFCSLFRRAAVQKKPLLHPTTYAHKHARMHTHLAVTMLHVGCFPPANLLCATLSFHLPTAAGLFSNSKQELCWFPPHLQPHYQNPPNKESCCLLAFCWRINRGREYEPLMSGVFCVFYCLSCFPPNSLHHPNPPCSCCTSASRAGATGAGRKPSAWTTWGLCWGPSNTKAAPPRSSSRWRSSTASRSR